MKLNKQELLKLYFRSFKLAFVFAALIILSSCKSVVIPVFSSQQPPITPNYNNSSAWAIMPNTYPENLKQKQTNEDILQADVFYIYPTLNIDKKDVDGMCQ